MECITLNLHITDLNSDLLLCLERLNMLIVVVDPYYMPSLVSSGIGIKKVIGCTLDTPYKINDVELFNTSNSSAYRPVIINLVTEI